ncbi:MAG: septal ring lytic transglycosylase RlpA family protein [Gammaproteobacteria bacterium]
MIQMLKSAAPVGIRLLWGLGLAGLLLGCSSTPAPEAGSRYRISQDRAPSRRVDPTSIAEVIPEPVARTAAGNRSPYTVLGKTYHVLSSDEGYNERGVASWYGEKFHGHQTSNGEIFDMYQVSAAHKSLPLPSFLRVTNLENNRSIIVRVNDRGPFHGDRLIDLSYAAALKLGFADRGTTRVLLESVTPMGPRLDRGTVVASTAQTLTLAPAGTYLQIGAYGSLDAAEQVQDQLQDLTRLPVIIRSVETSSAGTLYRVRVGPVADDLEIQRLSRRVVAANLGSPYTVTE